MSLTGGAPVTLAIGLPTTLEAIEKLALRATLELTGGKKKVAAVHLGISRSALYAKLARHGLLERVRVEVEKLEIVKEGEKTSAEPERAA